MAIMFRRFHFHSAAGVPTQAVLFYGAAANATVALPTGYISPGMFFSYDFPDATPFPKYVRVDVTPLGGSTVQCMCSNNAVDKSEVVATFGIFAGMYRVRLEVFQEAAPYFVEDVCPPIVGTTKSRGQ